jgi:hypothetical protein
MAQFYAYLWLRRDGTPYYAGKGTGRRAFTSKGHGGIHCPKDESRILIFERATEAEAFATEIELIANWGRKDIGTGCLRNRTNGGEGVSGGHWKLSLEAIANISAGLRGNTYTLGFSPSAETRAKLSAKTKANWESGTRPPISEEHKAKNRIANLGKKASAETREKLSAAKKGVKLSPEHCVNISAARMGKTPSPETRAKMRAAKLGRKRAPFSLETREKIGASKRGNTYRRDHKKRKSAEILLQETD